MMLKALILKKIIYKFEEFICASLFSAYLIAIHSFVQPNAFNYSNNLPDKAVQGVATVKQPTGTFLSCFINVIILSISSFPGLI